MTIASIFKATSRRGVFLFCNQCTPVTMLLFRVLIPFLGALFCWGSLAAAELIFTVNGANSGNTTRVSTPFYKVTGLGAAGTTWNAKGNSGLQISNAIIFKGVGSGLCFNIDSATESENYPLNIFGCFPGAANERYYLILDSSADHKRYYIVAAHSGKCLGSKGDIDTAGNNVVQTTCKVQDLHQIWWFEQFPDVRILSDYLTRRDVHSVISYFSMARSIYEHGVQEMAPMKDSAYVSIRASPELLSGNSKLCRCGNPPGQMKPYHAKLGNLF